MTSYTFKGSQRKLPSYQGIIIQFQRSVILPKNKNKHNIKMTCIVAQSVVQMKVYIYTVHSTSLPRLIVKIRSSLLQSILLSSTPLSQTQIDPRLTHQYTTLHNQISRLHTNCVFSLFSLTDYFSTYFFSFFLSFLYYLSFFMLC